MAVADTPRDSVDEASSWKGKVYKVTFQPMQTSNYFSVGDRLRIEVSSSDFPLYDRNRTQAGTTSTKGAQPGA